MLTAIDTCASIDKYLIWQSVLNSSKLIARLKSTIIIIINNSILISALRLDMMAVEQITRPAEVEVDKEFSVPSPPQGIKLQNSAYVLFSVCMLECWEWTLVCL